MLTFESIIATIAPHTCVDCGIEGRLLCANCAFRLPKTVERCYRCHKVSENSATCKSCRSQTKLTRVRTLTFYEGAAKDLVWLLKFGRARAGAIEIGRLLAPLIDADECDRVLFVPVPTATSRIRRRGYDQAMLIARALARTTNLPAASLLVRYGQNRQVGMGREKRRAQLAGAFRIRRPRLIRNAHIILVDDVITTGATLEAATAALKSAGARKVEAIIFAQA